MTKLEETYALFNSRYFRGSLPKCKVVWADIKHFGDYKPVEYWWYRGSKPLKPSRPTQHVIRIGKWSKGRRRQWAFTLLHECVHLKLYLKGSRHNHGPDFQREMKRLARLGAFNGLW